MARFSPLSCCLKTSFSLRKQLLLSFGTSAFVTLMIVALGGCALAGLAGERVKKCSDRVMREQVVSNMVASSRFVADRVQGQMDNLEGTVQLLAEMVQDRIVGYPELGWEDDRYVPFFDMDSKTNKYPLDSPLIPMEWNITTVKTNTDEADAFESFQERAPWYERFLANASTATASFFIQGACDPAAKPNSTKYYPNCTAANNDLNRGGVVQPTAMSKYLHEKASDLGVLLKPLYESQYDALLFTVHFHNMGAGAVLQYPGSTLNGLVEYESAGCDWMRQTNPRSGKPFGTEADIARCHKAGTLVPYREYNPAERPWFRDCALQADGVKWTGLKPPLGDGVPIFYLNRGVFDRRTGHFIACVSMNVMAEDLNKQLNVSLLHKESDLAVVRFEDGAVMADTLGSLLRNRNETTMNATESDSVLVTDTGLITKDNYEILKGNLNFEGSWTPELIQSILATNVVTCTYRNLFTAYPLPVPPDEYDPKYRPEMLIIHRISNDVFQGVSDMEYRIHIEVSRLSRMCLLIGIAALVAVIVIVFCVSRTLTQPLVWIEGVAWRIVNHTDKRAGMALDVSDDEEWKTIVRCTPRSEITALVSEFRAMIKGFSGTGAARVADYSQNEILNELTWQSDFDRLYSAHRPPPIVARGRHTSTNTDATLEEESGDEASKRTSSGDQQQGQSESQPDAKLESEPGSQPDLQQEENLDSQPQAQLQAQLHQYLRRQKQRNARKITDGDFFGTCSSNSFIVPAPIKKNRGNNVIPPQMMERKRGIGCLDEVSVACRSPLFWWILGLIVLPLLLTNAIICSIVTPNIRNRIPSWVVLAEEASLHLEIEALVSTARLKATFAQTMVYDPIRDLHLLTRFAGWLFFDGISRRREGFTRVQGEATEECKMYPPDGSCPYLHDSERSVCPCAWEDPWEKLHETMCVDFNDTFWRPRELQKRIFAGQAQGADPVTGRRDNTSFHQYDDSPSHTVWWHDLKEIPGAWKGSNASGFETTYDRLRVSSAMSVVEMPVYNYITSLGRQKFDLGTYIGFDADGLLTGVAGCDTTYSMFAHFQSNDENGAYTIAPDLCPFGQYGYDCRCRDWYASGKKSYFGAGEAAHITGSFPFAVDGEIATSATSPIANPKTNEYVGQVVFVFYPVGIRRSLVRLREPLAILITPEKDSTGGDTVVGPNKTEGWKSAAIADLMFPHAHDSDSSILREKFEKDVLSHMKNGARGVKSFKRRREDGVVETLRMAYEPVYARTLHTLDPGDFSRGVNVTRKLVYSVGIARREQDLLAPFDQVQDDIAEEVWTLIVIYTTLVVSASILFTVITGKITLHVTTPMITLLRIVESINRGQFEKDIPPLKGGSREVKQVYSSFSKLYKTVRISNTAFFSGNLKWAYHFVRDALKLFRKINDEKAIGIACNNLGNTLYAMHMFGNDAYASTCCSCEGECTTPMALEHYDEAISIGRQEFEQANHEELKADYAQQLADRLFNRGLFLLLVHYDGDPCAPLGARERGYEDIASARALDYDVREFWLEHKLLLKKSASCFCRLLSRIHGLITFYHDESLRAIWDLQELIEDADRLLVAAWNEPLAPLFELMTPIGRLQQLEAAVIRLELYLNKDIKAAEFAMRVFTEDEYILEGTFNSAAKALLRLTREEGKEEVSWTPKTNFSIRSDLRKMLNACKNATLDMGKCFVIALELTERWELDPILERVNANCLQLYDTCDRHDHVGIVAYTTRGDLTVQLGAKSENEGIQRATLDIATNSTSERVYPALPVAVQMVVDADASMEKDSFILLLTDGYSWDSDSCSSIRGEIERLNRQRNTAIHVIIIGLDVEEDSTVHECKWMSTVSRASFYADATFSNMDGIFDSISTSIMGSTGSFDYTCGITMEKF